jgi:Tfp pilus assembly protein PilF
VKRAASLAVIAVAVARAAPPDLVAVARQAQAAGEFDRAARAWRELLKQQPGNSEILSNLGVALYMEGRDDTAALDVLRRALKRNSTSVPANLFAGMCLTRMGQPRSALAHLDRAWAGDAKGPLVALALARAHVALRQFREANRFYYETTRRDPRLAEGWYGLGITYRTILKSAGAPAGPASTTAPASRSDFESALAALAADAGNTAARARIASVTAPLALEALATAVRLEPESDRAHLLLAEFYRDTGNTMEAVREYESAIRTRPDLAAAHLGLAAAFWKTGETERVTEPLNRALALAPDDPEANGILADLQVRSGDLAGARKAAELALRGNPDLAHVRAVMAKIHLAEDHPDLAVTELRRIAGQDETGSYHFLLHRALKQLGRDTEAEAALARFKAIREAMQQQRRSVSAEP